MPASTISTPSPRQAEGDTPADAPTAPAVQDPAVQDEDSVHRLHAAILQSLEDDQALDIISIPLEGKSSIADVMVIASGRSTRQVGSMAMKLADKIKATTGRAPRLEGLNAADWVLIDAADIIIHLFRPEVRSFYNLERMWSLGDAPQPPITAAAHG